MRKKIKITSTYLKDTIKNHRTLGKYIKKIKHGSLPQPASQTNVSHHVYMHWDQLRQHHHENYSETISIIIPMYNQAHLTIASCTSILHHGSALPFEIIIIDNNSHTSEAATIKAYCHHHSSIRYIGNDVNLNFAGACNLGASIANGSLLVFLNNDTIVTNQWLHHLVKPLISNNKIGISGPKLIYPDYTIQSAGLVFGKESLIPYHLYQGIHYQEHCVEQTRAFQALTGACLAIKTNDFYQLHGFDTAFINGCEDLDLCFRVTHHLQKKIMYIPQSLVIHHEGRTSGRSTNIMKNRELFADRYANTIKQDDITYYQQDAFTVRDYIKVGSEPHGKLALYHPVLQRVISTKQSTTSRTTKDSPSQYNVGFVSIWYERGISIHTNQLAQALEHHGITTHIFARWESKNFANTAMNFHPRVFNAGDDPSPDLLHQWTQKNKIDLLIFMEVHPNDWKRVACCKKNKLTCMAYENLDLLEKKYLRQYETFDYLLSHTQYGHQVFQKEFPHVKKLLIPWGIPPEAHWLQHRPIDPNNMRFVHIAGWRGIHDRKNSSLVLNAFHAAHPQNAHLHFFTQSPLSQYGYKAFQAAQNNQAIHIHQETLPDINIAYNLADILLCPSKREGVGLPILEALVSGIPVLTTDGKMMNEWPQGENHAYLIKGKAKQDFRYLPYHTIRVNDLATCIQEICNNPEQLQQKKNAVIKDQSRWQWQWQSKGFAEQIKQCCHDNSYEPDPHMSYLPDRLSH